MNDLRPWRNPEQILPVSSFLLALTHIKPLPQHFQMILFIYFVVWVKLLNLWIKSYAGAPNENIVQNHLNIALLNVI